MICPKCNQESINFDICPYCNYDFSTIPTELENKKNIDIIQKRLNIFYICVIIIGIPIIGLLLFNLINKYKKPDLVVYENVTTTKEIINTEYTKTNPIMPTGLGNLTLGSIKYNNNYYDAYVKGIRLIDSNEVSTLLSEKGIDYPLDAGFRYEGIEYSVSIKDNIKVSPVLNSVFYYTDTGNDYINIDENIFRINTVDIYDGEDILPNSEKRVIVLYETNTNDYSICLGYKGHNTACINPTYGT